MENLALVAAGKSPESELLEVVVAAGLRTSSESGLLVVVAAAGMRAPTSPESERLEAVGKRPRPDTETPVLEAAGMGTSHEIETLELKVVGMGTSSVIETQELGVDAAHNRLGQMKRGKEQSKHHLLQRLRWKPEFGVGVAESPPHPHGCQVPRTPDLHAHVEQAQMVGPGPPGGIPRPRGPAEEAPPLEAENRGRPSSADPAAYLWGGSEFFTLFFSHYTF